MSIYSILSKILRSGLVKHQAGSLVTPATFRSERGFSILEVLITTAIIGIITGLVTLRYGSFNNLILLKNQAYQVAIELREAQTRALSAAGSEGGFRRPYGIHFSMSNPDRYILFLDSNPDNGLYDSGEELETRRLDSRFRLKRLCSGSSISCTSLTGLSITFRRPNFDAIMNAGTVANGIVEIETLTGDSTRMVNVNAVGQITVE